MLKVLQVRTEENTSYRKKSSNLVKSKRSKIKANRLKIIDMKFLQNSISAQTLLKRFGFQVKHF